MREDSLGRRVEYYEERYSEPPGAMRDYAAYLDLLALRSGLRLIDIGCGEGFLLARAGRDDLQVFGLEIAMRALRLARERAPGARLVRAEGEALPFEDAAFDRVTCLGSLEHFGDPGRGAAEIARILRPGGLSLIVVPNRRFVGWLLRGERGTEQKEVAELLLDEDGWRETLESNGLRVLRIEKEPWHTKPQRLFAVRLALRVARAVIPRRWTYQFAFVCGRSKGDAGGR